MATDTMSTAPASNKRLGVFELFIVAVTAVLMLGIAATAVGLAGLAVVKGIDVLYAGEQFVEHWSDPSAVPADADLCKALFCRRADTEMKHIAGSAHRQSETFAAFCPEHSRTDWLCFLDISHLGTLLWYAYGAAVLVCTILWASLAGFTTLAVLGSPALLVLDAERRKAFFGLCATIGVLFGALIGSAASVAYVWW
jgi:hypothetical protein